MKLLARCLVKPCAWNIVSRCFPTSRSLQFSGADPTINPSVEIVAGVGSGIAPLLAAVTIVLEQQREWREQSQQKN